MTRPALIASLANAPVFAGEADEPRSRRATDALVGAVSVLAALVLGAAAQPQPGFERGLIQFVASVPAGFDGLWRMMAVGISVFAAVLVLATLVLRRWAVLRDAVCAAAVVVAAGLLSARVVLGGWPPMSDILTYHGGRLEYPPISVSVAVAVVLTISPHLTRRLRRLCRWLIGAAVAGVIVLGAASPIGAGIAFLIGVASAAAMHLGFGSSNGRPRVPELVRALHSLGIDVIEIGAAQRQSAGVFVLDAADVNDVPLTVKVYGRDAHDTQLLTTAWRTIWYRESGSPAWFGRREQAEHEAFLTNSSPRSRGNPGPSRAGF